MRSIIALGLSGIVAATPAFAWTDSQGMWHQNINTTAQATAQQHQAQGQHQTATGGHSSATGGTATGGSSNVSNNVVMGSSGGGAGGVSRAPDVNLPSIGGGGMDCPTVGFGAGGSGLGGGGGIGPSWISSDCNKRRVASLLATLYGPAVARAYAEANIDGVKEAVAAAGLNEHVEYPYDWCWTRDAGNRRQREVCEGNRR